MIKSIAHVIFEQLHCCDRLPSARSELVLDLAPGHVLHMQARAASSVRPRGQDRARDGRKRRVHRNARRASISSLNSRPALPSRSCGRLFSSHKPGAGFERIAHVKLKRIFVARHTGDPSLRPCRVGVGPLRFVITATEPCCAAFRAKLKPGDPAPDHHEIVNSSHFSRRLSISRVLPMKTASAMTALGLQGFQRLQIVRVDNC